MSDELSTDEVIDQLAGESNDANINDFTDFNDVDISDISSEEGGEESTPQESVSEDGEQDTKSTDDGTDEKEKLELDETKEESKETKMLSATFEDKSIEINPETKFKHVVDGKEVEVTAQELLNDFSGQKSWNQKFSELGEEKKTFTNEKNVFESQKNELVGNVNSFVDAVQKDDPVRALESLATLAGSNPVELREYFIDMMRDQAIKYVQLSPEQQKELDMQVKSKYHEDRSAHLEETINSQNAHVELTNQITGLQRKYDISDEELVKMHDELKDKSELSLEALEKTMISNVSQGKASTLLDQVDPSLKEKEGYVEQVSSFMQQNPDLKDEEVLESIKDAIKVTTKPEVKTSSKESASTQLKNKLGKTSKESTNSQQSEDDDLDDVVDFDEVVI